MRIETETRMDTIIDDLSDADMSAVRSQLSDLAAEVAHMTERRAKRLATQARHGVWETQATIATYPLTSIAAATLAGAAIGLAVTSQRTTRPARHWSDPRRYRNAAYAADVQAYLPHIPAAVAAHVPNVNMTDRLERLAASLSKFDVQESLKPLADKIASYIPTVKNAASDAVDSVRESVKQRT